MHRQKLRARRHVVEVGCGRAHHAHRTLPVSRRETWSRRRHKRQHLALILKRACLLFTQARKSDSASCRNIWRDTGSSMDAATGLQLAQAATAWHALALSATETTKLDASCSALRCSPSLYIHMQMQLSSPFQPELAYRTRAQASLFAAF